MTNEEPERALFPRASGKARDGSPPFPDWPHVHRELRRKGVTLALLWQECRDAHPDGYEYSWFCELYRRWSAKLLPVMRQRHPAGERMFTDYADVTSRMIR